MARPPCVSTSITSHITGGPAKVHTVVNFIQQPRPFNSPAGAINDSQACFDRYGEEACLQPGALGQDQRASTGLTSMLQLDAPSSEYSDTD